VPEGPAQSALVTTPKGGEGWRTRALRKVLRLVPDERHRLFWLTIVIGGVCGLAAVAFHSAIRVASAALIERGLAVRGPGWMVWAIVVPTAGALLSGLLLHYLVPQARGSGIPQVKLAYAVKSGRVRLRDAVGKFLVATLQLGTGSALGREGPTVQISVGIATTLGRLFAISPRNLRRLIPTGAAAGIAAAFNAPIAAVTFAIEEIVGDLDQTVLSGVVVAAALAAVVEHTVLGAHPVFHVPGTYGLDHASSLLIYGVLGVAAAVVAHVFYELLLWLRMRFRTMHTLHPAAKPAVGGLATGVLTVVTMLWLATGGVSGDGYTTLSTALDGDLALDVMLALVVAKLLATAFSYSSGGAGGIFAPVLFIGGMLGGSFGHLDRWLLDHPDSQLGAFALVGMGAFFAAVIRAPITSVLIIFEMTRSYGLVLPLMIANATAYVLARRLQPLPIYEALLAQDGYHLPHAQRTGATLSSFRVGDAMTTELVQLRAEETIEGAARLVHQLAYSIYPVVDGERGLVGLVSEARIRRRLAEGEGDKHLRQLARAEETLASDLPLAEAVTRMTKLGVRQMAVVAPDESHRLVGILAMSDIMRAYSRAAEGESGTYADDTSRSVRPAVSWKHRDSSVLFQNDVQRGKEPPQ
jgi:CIC family chloride channel protein